MPSLSLHARSGQFAVARNVMPIAQGGARTRPGAVQVFGEACLDAVSWGPDRWFVDSGGAWKVITTNGGVVADLGASTPLLSAAAYQALVGGAVREDRLYFGCSDGVLRYVLDAGAGVYTLHTVVNEVLDGASTPYPINPARGLAVWQQRLWSEELTNRVSHCMANLPHSWDPLHTLEFQSGRKDATTCLLPFGPQLVVGCLDSLWTVSGDSPFNWDRSQLAEGRGAVGRFAMTGDGSRGWHVDETGVYRLGSDSPISEDIDELFDQPDYDAALELAPGGEYLLLVMHGRVFACLLAESTWGELDLPGSVYGLWTDSDSVGFYGSFGVWIITRDFVVDDRYADGTSDPIVTEIETWDELNPEATRLLLRRLLLTVRGAPGSEATYTPVVNGVSGTPEIFSLSDGAAPPPPGGGVFPDLLAAVPAVRELTPLVAGESIRHQLRTPAFLELISMISRITSEAH